MAYYDPKSGEIMLSEEEKEERKERESQVQNKAKGIKTISTSDRIIRWVLTGK